MDKDQVMESAFEIVSFSGDAKSAAMEAIKIAKSGDIDSARQKLDEAKNTVANAHHLQTDLISAEANGVDIPFSIVVIHGQDHLMTAMSVIDLAEEFIDVYEKIN